MHATRQDHLLGLLKRVYYKPPLTTSTAIIPLMRIGSIDIGIRNCAICVFDSDLGKVEHIEVLDLCAPGNVRFGDQSVVYLVARVVEARKDLFASCEIVGIEKQMMRSMLNIQFSFEALLHPLTAVVQVPPQAVKRMFKTSCNNYAKNKKAAVRKLYELIDVRGKQLLERFAKKDDVADAILQAMYVGENASGLMKKKESYRIAKKRPRRKTAKAPAARKKRKKK